MTASPYIIALDFPHGEQALAMADQLDPAQCRVKVGKELFTREGPAIIQALHAREFEVFLDLKFHDIPNTVARACAVAADLGVWMVNVHASGGERMLSAAKEAVVQSGGQTLLIAVTVLTSMDAADLAGVGIECEPAQQVMRLAKLTQACGLDGVVCSAQECAQLRSALGPDFKLVTPGIRPPGAAADDQRRTLTPAEALAAGASYLVVGRPVTQAAEPLSALADLNQALQQA